VGDSQEFKKTEVTVGCGCKILKDVITFAKEKKIEHADLAWADEMGLWHHIVVPIGDLTEYGVVSTKDGKVLKPDPLTAKISPFSAPNTMHMSCVDASYESSSKEARRDLKTKQLNPVLIEMIQKKLLESQTRQSVEIDRLLNSEEPVMGFYQRPGDNFIEWKMVSKADRSRDSPTFSEPTVPGSPSSPFSDVSPTASSPDSSPNASPVPGPNSNMKMKLQKSMNSLEPFEALDLPPGYKPPPLLRPRQVHPCKNKYDDKKAKKRKAMEHMFCRHCGAKDTPEWRRGPDGRKSLCNACGLHYSKVIKKETLTVAAGRCVSVNSLLNPA